VEGQKEESKGTEARHRRGIKKKKGRGEVMY